MKIAIIEEFSRVGGGQKFALMLSDMLREEGFDISFITDSEHRFLQNRTEKIQAMKFKYIDGKNPVAMLLEAIRLKGELKLLTGFDFVINNHPNMFLFNGGINSLHSISIAEQLISENGDIQNDFLFKILKYSRFYKIYENGKFWVPTKFNRDISLRIFELLGIKHTKFLVLPIPFTNIPDVNLNEKRDQILIFGRISRDKGTDLVFDLAKQIDKKFIIAGAVNPGNERYYKNLQESAPNNVTIIPNPGEEIKDTLFRQSKMYLHLRKRENFPISVLEAISYGCVPIVPKNGGMWTDIIQQGKFGLGYDSLSEVAYSVNKAEAMSENEIKVILNSRERFSYKDFKSKYLKMVTESVK